ncbi:hypothetical protein V8D89_010982 [Ganoderma adspersum]
MTELNFDVLRLICGLIAEVPDVLSFSLICSMLHPVAVKRRLSMRTITISSVESIRDLYSFVFVDEVQCGQHICSITVPVHGNTPSSSKELVDCLLSIFQSARRVHTISLCVPSLRTQSLFCDPTVLAAVAKMASVQELNVVAPLRLVAKKLLPNVPVSSALKTFRYSETYDGHQGLPLCVYVAPWLAAMLQEIELPFDFMLRADDSYTHISFPAVRSLVLKRVNSELDLDILLAMFPNLDHTFIIDDAFLVPSCNLPMADRDENRRRAGARNVLPWKSLDRVFADPDILHSLGLDCPVRHLTLSMRRWGDSPSHRPWASSGNVPTVLREHAPTHLALVGISLPDGLSHLDDMLYPGPRDAASGITHLVLDAAYRNIRMAPDLVGGMYETPNSSARWDVVLDAVLRGLEVLPNLTHVRIVVHCEVNLGYPFCSPLYDSARRFKFHHLVSALQSAVPSLTHVFITSAGRSYRDVDAWGLREEQERWGTSRAWRVRRFSPSTSGTPGGMQGLPDELSREEAEALIDVEEMRGTERKKVLFTFLCPFGQYDAL